MADNYSGYNDSLRKLSVPTRNRYFYGKLLDSYHFELEQAYFNRKRWLMNRLATGAGVICGLDVVKTNDNKQIRVTPGVGIDFLGHEIIVSDTSPLVDPRQLTDACGKKMGAPIQGAGTVTLCLDYLECDAEPVPVLVGDCDTHNTCAPSMIRERYRLLVHRGLPDPVAGLSPELCRALTGEVGTIGAKGFSGIATLNVGGTPEQVAIAPKGNRALLLNTTAPNVLQVIDLDNQTISTPFATDLVTLPLGGVSIAPDGGSIFVTHAKGVVAISLDNNLRRVLARFLADKTYSVCASAFGGAVLFAVNNATQQIDRIDVASQTVMASITVDSLSLDLALSADSRWLYILNKSNRTLLRLDTATNALTTLQTFASAAQTLALRTTSTGILAYVAGDNKVWTVAENGTTTLLVMTAIASNSGFTTDGSLYYLLSNPPIGSNSTSVPELVIVQAEGWTELTRIKVGTNPLNLAIAPHQRLALVVNQGDATVSVIDFDRHRLLCASSPKTCAEPPFQSCIPLATIELKANGTFEIDTCTYRPKVYSNEALFNMILCLAERLEECCQLSVRPGPTNIPEPVPVPNPYQYAFSTGSSIGGSLLGTWEDR